MATKLIVLLSFTLVVPNRSRRSDSEDSLDRANESNLCFQCCNSEKTVYTKLTISMVYTMIWLSCACMHIGFLAEYSAENENCEELKDTILDYYCKNTMTSVQPECTNTIIPTTTTIVSPSKCSRTETITIQSTKIITTSLSCSQLSTSPLFVHTTNNISSKLAAVNGIPTPIMVLGALLALAVVLLVLVITGWVCTCLIAKKRNR